MKQKAIQMLDVVYFLVTKYGYEQIKVSGSDDEFWLYNKERPRFNTIRLTTDSLSKLKESKNEVEQKAKNALVKLNDQPDIMSIHFTHDDTNLFFEPGLYQGKVNSEEISPILVEEFPGIQYSLMPIGTDLKHELSKRQVKFSSYKQRESQPKVDMKALRSELKKNFKFTWTHGLILINVIFFIVGLIVQYLSNQTFSMIFMGSLYKPLVYGANEWWRIITSAFIHADFFHILINMMALVQTGILVERVYGKKEMLFIYFSAMLTSSLLALINMSSSFQTVGASGAIFGLMGAIIVYLFSSGLYKVPNIRNQIITTLLINVIITFMPGVSMYGHLGGFVGGVLAAMFISKAQTLKSAKTSALISLSMLIGGMFMYAYQFDTNLFDTRVDLDKMIVANYYKLGFEKHAENLIGDYIIYYDRIGEEFK